MSVPLLSTIGVSRGTAPSRARSPEYGYNSDGTLESPARLRAHLLLSAMEKRTELFPVGRAKEAKTREHRASPGPFLVLPYSASKYRGDCGRTDVCVAAVADREVVFDRDGAAAIRRCLFGFTSKLDRVLERVEKQAEEVSSMCMIYARREAELEQLMGVLTRLRSVAARVR